MNNEDFGDIHYSSALNLSAYLEYFFYSIIAIIKLQDNNGGFTQMLPLKK
jgi:hypothetical protein